jgi:hypothetical protein
LFDPYLCVTVALAHKYIIKIMQTTTIANNPSCTQVERHIHEALADTTSVDSTAKVLSFGSYLYHDCRPCYTLTPADKVDDMRRIIACLQENPTRFHALHIDGRHFNCILMAISIMLLLMIMIQIMMIQQLPC